jgi:hypothetical protein
MRKEKSRKISRIKAIEAKRGCGAYLGNCGHQGSANQTPNTISGTCACGRVFSFTCTSKGCTGKDYHC